MPRPLPEPTGSWYNERHIFMRGVPQNLALVAIPDYFDKFNPTSRKILNPANTHTTIVFGFEKGSDARRALKETIYHVIEGYTIRVEIYATLRFGEFPEPVEQDENRTSNVKEPESGLTISAQKAELWPTLNSKDAEVKELKTVQSLASLGVANSGQQYPSWASIVANDKVEPSTQAPDLSRSDGPASPTSLDDTPILTPHITSATPVRAPVTDDAAGKTMTEMELKEWEEDREAMLELVREFRPELPDEDVAEAQTAQSLDSWDDIKMGTAHITASILGSQEPTDTSHELRPEDSISQANWPGRGNLPVQVQAPVTRDKGEAKLVPTGDSQDGNYQIIPPYIPENIWAQPIDDRPRDSSLTFPSRTPWNPPEPRAPE